MKWLLFLSLWFSQEIGPGRNIQAASILVNSVNGQSSTGSWGSCGDTACAGGAGNTTSITQTTGISSPSVSGSAMSLAATFPATGNNVLYFWKPGTCDACQWIKFDTYVYLPTGIANYEFDSFIFCKTCTANPSASTGMDAMFGKQCNTVTGFWQYANQSSSWTNSTIACSLTTGTWHHIIFSDFYNQADTSCTGGLPCLHYGTINIDGTSFNWNVTLPLTALDPSWASTYGCQFQMDSSASGTKTEYIDNVGCSAGK